MHLAVSANSLVRALAAGGPASGSVAAQDAGSTVLYAGMAGLGDGGGTVGGHVFAQTMLAGSAGGTTGVGRMLPGSRRWRH